MPAPRNAPALSLDDFLPYCLSVTANRVAQDLAQIYEQRFNLGIPEWRVMAAVGEAQGTGLSGRAVAERTAMDKVRVSRAVSGLKAKGLLRQTVDGGDRRRSLLRLTAKGQAVYAKIIPAARAREAWLLAQLSQDEIRDLKKILARLRARIEGGPSH